MKPHEKKVSRHIQKERRSDSDFEPGDKLGPYLIISNVGKGSSGVVYKAKDSQSKKIVAIKILFIDEKDPMLEIKRKRMKREFEAAKLLNHPNIVSISEIGVYENSQIHFIMDFIEGITLSMGIKENIFSQRELFEFIEKIARALDYAHSKGIVHRDIKPANIIITPQKEPMITDLGLAKKIDSTSVATLPGRIVGTLHYMAPEQVLGKNVDGRSDIYSLGIILYHILTGSVPFSGEELLGDVLRRKVKENPTLPRKINPAVNEDIEFVCLKAIQREPEDRYETANDMADDVRRFLNGEHIHASLIIEPDKKSWVKDFLKETGTLKNTFYILLFCAMVLFIYLVLIRFGVL